MKKLLLFLLTAVIVLPLTGCFADTGKVVLGEEFELKISESAIVRGEDFEITFLEVLEDSRCPKGAICLWMGEARSLVRMSLRNTTEDIELHQYGLRDEPEQQTYRDYAITFYLYPYHESGEEIDLDEYYLQITINREPSGN